MAAVVPDNDPGRRGARLTGHGQRVARRAKGIEGALVDSEVVLIGALHPADGRSFRVAVAGPAALFVAKLHKVAERVNDPDRLADRHALDLLCLLRAVPTGQIAAGLRGVLGSERARAVTTEALSLARELLSRPDSPGPQMAARAAGALEDPEVIANSLATLWSDLSDELQRRAR